MLDSFALGLGRPPGKRPAGSGNPPAAVASDVIFLDRHPGIILALVVHLVSSLHHPAENAPREKKKTSGFSEFGFSSRGWMMNFDMDDRALSSMQTWMIEGYHPTEFWG